LPVVSLSPSRVGRRDLLLGVGAAMLSGCSAVALREARLRKRAENAGFRAATHRLGDATVRVYAGGTGTPLLALHGFGGSALWQWDRQLERFARQHRVLVPDLLWFGDSSATGTPTLAAQVQAMIALLDARGVERAAIVGVSYGGMVAWELAARNPERVSQLVLGDSPGDVWTPSDHTAMLARLKVTRAAEVFVPSTPDGVRRLLALAYADPPSISSGVARQVVRELYDPHRAAQVALMDELEVRIARPAVDAPRPIAPMRILWGDGDPVFPLAVGQRLAASTGAALVPIAEARHQPNLEYPDRFAAEVLVFTRL
jgi:pimeloyl-ACP methyl ester carboxylesterase